MRCSINFHEHCLLLLVFFLVLHECYSSSVLCFMNTRSLVFCEHCAILVIKCLVFQDLCAL
jgi:hypothetical protein